MNRALADRLLSLLPEEYKGSFIAQQSTKNPKMTFLEVFKWFYNQYGIATEEEIIKNMAKLLNNWSPHEGMEKFIGHFDKSVTYASFAGQATASNTIVTYFLTVIKKTGKYQRAYKDWLARDDNSKTWAQVKDFWRMEHLKLRRSNPIAFQYQFGGNAAQDQGENKHDMANILKDCANQLMNRQQAATAQ